MFGRKGGQRWFRRMRLYVSRRAKRDGRQSAAKALRDKCLCECQRTSYSAGE
jgi:hypothetical protein